jgi:hypothetical protein
MSNVVTTFAIKTFASITAKYLPAQLNGPMLNGICARLSLIRSGLLNHRSGYPLIGSLEVPVVTLSRPCGRVDDDVAD